MLVKFSPKRESISEFPDLIPEKEYMVIGIEYDYFRILNEHRRPYLYPQDLFVIVDASHPEWIETWDNGQLTAYPQELNGIGFFEDLLEGDSRARATFDEYLRRGCI